MKKEWSWFGLETVSRHESAAELVKKCADVSEENASCTIKGSGKEAYSVTLHTCTCPDFSINANKGITTPCKHMLALGMRLGLVPAPQYKQFFAGARKLPLLRHGELTRMIADVAHGDAVPVEKAPELSGILYIRDGNYAFTASAESVSDLARKKFAERIAEIADKNLDNADFLRCMAEFE